MSKHRWLILLLTMTFFKGLVTSLLVPMWEVPDEQAHFAQVDYYANATMPLSDSYLDVSAEVLEAQKAMGTVRINMNNYYTYHPEFKITYSDSLTGPHETYLQTLPENYRHTYVAREAARYPFLFYQLSRLGYGLADGGSIIERLFATRLVSLALMLGSVLVSYWVGLLMFNRRSFALTLASLVSFHPMFSFVGSGVNNDNLLNLLSFMVIGQSLYIFRSGWSYRRGLLLSVFIILGMLTKPLMAPLIPAVGLVILWQWWRDGRPHNQALQIGTALLLVVLIFGRGHLARFINTGQLPYFTSTEISTDLTLMEYLPSQLGRYYRETLVWYWGIFKWLGVMLPINIIRAIKVVMVVAGLGLIKLLVKPNRVVRRSHLLVMLILSLVYIGLITIWDYDALRRNGFSHGLQGRYFFPTLIAHLSLLLTGFMAWWPSRYRHLGLVAVVTLMAIVHTVSLSVLANAYYDTSNMRIFLTQLSQYKPWYFKYPFSLVWFWGYVTALLYSGGVVIKKLRHRR